MTPWECDQQNQNGGNLYTGQTIGFLQQIAKNENMGKNPKIERLKKCINCNV